MPSYNLCAGHNVKLGGQEADAAADHLCCAGRADHWAAVQGDAPVALQPVSMHSLPWTHRQPCCQQLFEVRFGELPQTCVPLACLHFVNLVCLCLLGRKSILIAVAVFICVHILHHKSSQFNESLFPKIGPSIESAFTILRTPS